MGIVHTEVNGLWVQDRVLSWLARVSMLVCTGCRLMEQEESVRTNCLQTNETSTLRRHHTPLCNLCVSSFASQGPRVTQEQMVLVTAFE